MHRRIPLLIAAVAALCLAIVVPTASAASKTDKAQTKALKKQSKAIKKNSSSIKTGSKDVTALKNSAKAVTGAIDALKVIADRADKNGLAFQTAAPTVIKGLTDLKDGLTAAGAGLTGLQTAVGATEYGWIEETAPAVTPAPTFHVTPDIPDAGQQAEATITSIAGTTGSVTSRFGVRSNENDGTGSTAATEAAGCVVTMINLANGTVASSGAGLTSVPSKATFQAVAGSPFAVVAGQDQPVTGPSLGVTAGQTYTIRFQCVDQSPPSAANPAG